MADAAYGRHRPRVVVATAAVIGGAIGGGIVGAIILLSGGGSSSSNNNSQTGGLSITSVQLAATTVTVSGTAHLPRQTVIYAIAQPTTVARQMLAPAGHRWDVSGPAVPDRQGTWSETFYLFGKTRVPIKVVAVEWQQRAPQCRPGATCSTPEAPPPVLLARYGPQASRGLHSPTVTARP